MQLVAYGAQDTYLTGTPSVTFFQAVYQQSTNFAMEVIQQTVNGTATNSAQVSVIVARNGDLLGQMEITLAPLLNNVLTSNSYAYDTNYIAERAISTVTLNIGGQQIDKHYQTWWRLYSELFLTSADKAKYNKMVSSIAPVTSAGSGSTPYRVHLPLLFFFNRNPGLFLPLVSLQYAEVRLDFVLSPYYSSYFDSTFEVWGNYVYLDTNERTQFASQPNQYLIEQLQTSNGDTITTVGETSPQLVRLNFNHPVKELVWCYQVPNATTAGNLNGMWNFTTNPSNVNVSLDPRVAFSTNTLVTPDILGVPRVFAGSNVIVDAAMGYVQNGVYKSMTEEGKANTAANGYEVGPLHQFKVVLNGQDRFKEQYGRYFNQVQPYYYHSGNPQPGVYAYSFALQPEEFQPTGTCNFSRIDNAQVFVALKTGSQSTIQKLFAVNYNILNVASGMAGLAFSS